LFILVHKANSVNGIKGTAQRPGHWLTNNLNSI